MQGKDHRALGLPITRVDFPQFAWASGETANVTQTVKGVNMLVERILVVVDDSAANRTNTFVSVQDELGSTLINSTDITASFTAMADGTTDALSTRSTPDFDAVPIAGDVTIVMSISGDPEAAHTANVYFFGP